MTSALVLRENNIDQYMSVIRKHALLSREEEHSLALAYRDENDVAAAHRLVTSNLRFVVKIAHEYKNYGFKMYDIIQEGNVGLMLAVKKFDPDKGYRLISYAVWWIRAQIQSYVQRSWSMVKLGLNSSRRKLFFKVRSERMLADREAGPGNRASTAELAERLQVGEADVIDMEMRMAARDFSLDTAITNDTSTTHLDMLPESAESYEDEFGAQEEAQIIRKSLDGVKESSNEKECYIIDNRLLSDNPESLQAIGDRFGVSRERIRQLESRVMKKLKESIIDANLRPELQ